MHRHTIPTTKNIARHAATLLIGLCLATVASAEPIEITAPGKIRAKGPMGLMAVKGTLTVTQDELCWRVEEDVDCAPCTLIEDGAQLRFEAGYTIERGEQVLWTGLIEGDELSEVEAVWTREPGDFIHDLLLPPEVTMVFKPTPKPRPDG